MDEEKFRPYTVLVMQDDEVIEMHSMPSLSDAIDRVTDLMIGGTKGERLRVTSLNISESPLWYRVAPTDEVEEEL